MQTADLKFSVKIIKKTAWFRWFRLMIQPNHSDSELLDVSLLLYRLCLQQRLLTQRPVLNIS